MIDLQALRKFVSDGPGEECLPLTRNALRQMLRELEAGRAAAAMLDFAQNRLEGHALRAAVGPAIEVGEVS